MTPYILKDMYAVLMFLCKRLEVNLHVMLMCYCRKYVSVNMQKFL